MCAGLCKAGHQSGLTAGFRKLAIIASVDGRLIDLNEQIVHTLTMGKWPMLKELHADLRPFPKWELPNLVSWQASEPLCECTCRQKWPDLEVLNIPSAQEMRMRMERAGVAMCYNIMFEVEV